MPCLANALFGQCPVWPMRKFFPDLMYDRYQFSRGRIPNVPKLDSKLE
ncbi:hypothetical protein [Microcoleus sp. Pol10D4]